MEESPICNLRSLSWGVFSVVITTDASSWWFKTRSLSHPEFHVYGKGTHRALHALSIWRSLWFVTLGYKWAFCPCHYDGCLTHGLGRCYGQSLSPGSLERPSSLLVPQPPKEEGSVFSTKTLLPRSRGLSCVDVDGQCISSHSHPLFRLVQQILPWADANCSH